MKKKTILLQCNKLLRKYAIYREDHFSLFDMPWISSLRFVDPSDENSPGKNKQSVATVPDKYPPFFDEDMMKWKQKFEKQRKERQEYKKMMGTTLEFNITTKNSNFFTTTYKSPKRRMSRQSAETFGNIDFEIIGNTNNVRNYYCSF